ncbi:cytochrome c oxidase subunit 7A2, mitochondrial-like [Coccinella septempunctata]|uniref:cytochrome c oxidase subunit 7A2, mitochondrial-like n=1 Tax=Coccinella septempunctata TaxID=41139 RepID=UPI001D07DA02|nr:cytochrome c oxidase subunit 7A2, mitochondrial-like [Coccinella septempunctata]
MNAAKRLVPVSGTLLRQFHKTNVVRATEEQMYAKRQRLRKLQEKFQIPDGTPVYLKGGFTDRLLFGTTCILLLVSMGMSAETIYQLLIK